MSQVSYLYTFVLPIEDLEFRDLYEVGRTTSAIPVAAVAQVRSESDIPLSGAELIVIVPHSWNIAYYYYYVYDAD